METLSTEAKKIAYDVCKYCSLQIDEHLFPQIDVKRKQDGVYAVLYNPYNALNQHFKYIYYREHPADGKFALVCREDLEKYINSQGKKAWRTVRESLDVIRNGKIIWSKSQDAVDDRPPNVLRLFIYDSQNDVVNNVDMHKYEMMDVVMTGINIASRAQRRYMAREAEIMKRKLKSFEEYIRSRNVIVNGGRE